MPVSGEKSHRTAGERFAAPKPSSQRIQMTETKKQKSVNVIEIAPEPNSEAITKPGTSLGSSLSARLNEELASGLTPSGAVNLVAQIMAEVPAASKEELDQIKMLDKLLNTARALMESRFKTEEAAAISDRLDELEAQIERLAEDRASKE
jgi:hypothetical protein